MKFINLTPHVVHVFDAAADHPNLIDSFEPSGQVARVSSTSTQVDVINGIGLNRVVYAQVQGLPEPDVGSLFIVSAMVRAACPDRKDLVSPGELLRDSDGVPFGCRGFAVT